MPQPLLHGYHTSYQVAPPYKIWRRLDRKRVRYEAGNPNLTYYLVLGHVATSEKTTPFEQFLPISHEVKFESGVEDRFLSIYLLSLAQKQLEKMLYCDFP